MTTSSITVEAFNANSKTPLTGIFSSVNAARTWVEDLGKQADSAVITNGHDQLVCSMRRTQSGTHWFNAIPWVRELVG